MNSSAAGCDAIDVDHLDFAIGEEFREQLFRGTVRPRIAELWK